MKRRSPAGLGGCDRVALGGRTRRSARGDRGAPFDPRGAVAECPDIVPLLARLKVADAKLRELRAARNKVTPMRASATPRCPPRGNRRLLQRSVRVLNESRRAPAMCSGPHSAPSAWFRSERATAWNSLSRRSPMNRDCGGALFGLPQTTLRALVSSSRGSSRVRVIRPKRADRRHQSFRLGQRVRKRRTALCRGVDSCTCTLFAPENYFRNPGAEYALSSSGRGGRRRLRVPGQEP